MQQEGFWYSVGRGFYKFFGMLEWTYNHLTPNIIFIILGAICMVWWILWQHKYNKKAIETGGYK